MLENEVVEQKKNKKKDKILCKPNILVPEEEEVILHDSESLSAVKIPKKRGRKPKGGKIVKQPVKNDIDENNKPNIILHLKCSISDVEENVFSITSEAKEININKKVDGFSFNNKELN
jgi:hypothetical protein